MHCLASTPTNRFFTNSYEKKKPFGVSMKDPSVIVGLKKSLKNRKMGDHVMVIVNPEDAYGTKGLKGYVAANEPVFYDIHVVDVF
jgi:FKBP-type peptidyl-prolyl cis-trans isomerase